MDHIIRFTIYSLEMAIGHFFTGCYHSGLCNYCEWGLTLSSGNCRKMQIPSEIQQPLCLSGLPGPPIHLHLLTQVTLLHSPPHQLIPLPPSSTWHLVFSFSLSPLPLKLDIHLGRVSHNTKVTMTPKLTGFIACH